VAVYVAREVTGASFTFIGKPLDRDHTTILWAWRVVKA
jgi:chromosomal replication initiation ATPase DnaA